MKTEFLNLDLKELKENEENPRFIDREGLEKLVQSLKDFPEMLEVRPIIIDENNVILAGNQRFKALKRLKYEKVKVLKVSGLSEGQKKELIIKDNIPFGNWHLDKLKKGFELELLESWGLDLDLNLEDLDLEWELEKPQKQEEKTLEIKQNESVDFSEIDIFLFALSGGRDSTLSLLHSYKKVLSYGKHTEIIFVDNGAEFHSVYLFVFEIAKKVGIPLTVLRGKTFYELYIKKGEWPDVVYRDCTSRLINDTIDKYVKEKFSGKKVLIIRGGRKTQSTNRGGKGNKKGEFQKIKEVEGVFLWNPNYDLEEDEYQELLKKIPVWKGYEKGFQRTACWMCPFQKNAQWEAMKIHEPFLFEEMKKLAKTMKRKEYPDKKKGYDIFWHKFDEYWKNQ